MKCCNKCDILKPLSSYHKRTNKIDSYVSWCKECHINYKKEARKTKKGVLASIYEGQIYSSKKRGHNKPCCIRLPISKSLENAKIMVENNECDS